MLKLTEPVATLLPTPICADDVTPRVVVAVSFIEYPKRPAP